MGDVNIEKSCMANAVTISWMRKCSNHAPLILDIAHFPASFFFFIERNETYALIDLVLSHLAIFLSCAYTPLGHLHPPWLNHFLFPSLPRQPRLRIPMK